MNGSGKTTLLSILAGFKHKSGGTVRLFGQEFTEENILEIRKRIGWISASFLDQIYKNESVINIVLSGKFGTAGLDTGLTDNDYKLAAVLLKDLGIAEKAELPFKFLSKGERQNVLIARAFMGQPSVLLLDEPCSGLDIVAREKFLQTVMKLADRLGAVLCRRPLSAIMVMTLSAR
jgi:iron complex transport system ATP-binding protein